LKWPVRWPPGQAIFDLPQGHRQLVALLGELFELLNQRISAPAAGVHLVFNFGDAKSQGAGGSGIASGLRPM
jgi:hypothetical protein